MSIFFDRQAELIIGDNVWTYPELNIKFKIIFDYDPEPNISTIQIYNLSKESINLITKGQNLTLNAGYGDDIGNICSGVIYQVNVIRKSQDNVVLIKVIDVQTQYLDYLISKTYNGPVKASFIINDIMSKVGLKINKLDLQEDIIYKNGFVAHDKLVNLLRKLSLDTRSQLIIQNTSISIIRARTGAVSAYVLSADTGLINIEKTENTRTYANYKVEAFLLHAISTRSFIEIHSENFKGTAMVIEGEHRDFKTIMEVITVG